MGNNCFSWCGTCIQQGKYSEKVISVLGEDLINKDEEQSISLPGTQKMKIQSSMNNKKKEVLHEILIENRGYIVFDAILIQEEEFIFFLKMEF